MPPQSSDLHLQSSAAAAHIEEVWVAVLHWRGVDCTRACLTSLTQLSYPRVKILLIDNGSANSEGVQLSGEFAGAECLRLNDNLGFAGGFNAGVEYCRQHGAQWIWLLNNDTVVAPDSLSFLMQEALKNPRAGVLSAAVRYNGFKNDDRNRSVITGPGEIDFLRAKTYCRPLKNCSDAAVTAQWLSGSNLLLRCAALTDDYVFDPAYYLYFEDTEFCVRMRARRWECLFVPAAIIDHAGGASTTGNLEYWRAYYYTRNRLLFFGTAFGAGKIPGKDKMLAAGVSTSNVFSQTLSVVKTVPAFISIFAHLLRHFIVLPFRGVSGRKQLKAEYLGLRDYLLNRFGKATCLDWCE